MRVSKLVSSAGSPGAAAWHRAVVGYANRGDEHACRGCPEVLRHCVVVEREAGRAVVEGERGEGEPSGRDARLELRGAVAARAQRAEHLVEVGGVEHRVRRVAA